MHGLVAVEYCFACSQRTSRRSEDFAVNCEFASQRGDGRVGHFMPAVRDGAVDIEHQQTDRHVEAAVPLRHAEAAIPPRQHVGLTGRLRVCGLEVHALLW